VTSRDPARERASALDVIRAINAGRIGALSEPLADGSSAQGRLPSEDGPSPLPEHIPARESSAGSESVSAISSLAEQVVYWIDQATQAQTERDEAVEELAIELAEERTLHQEALNALAQKVETVQSLEAALAQAQTERDEWRRQATGWAPLDVWVKRAERAEVALAQAQQHAGEMLRDVDTALGLYGQAFTTSAMPASFDRAATFEKARLALRRVRDALAAVSAAQPARAVADDCAAFARGERNSDALTLHHEFARCPECGNATVGGGEGEPYGINHEEGCSAPGSLSAAQPASEQP